MFIKKSTKFFKYSNLKFNCKNELIEAVIEELLKNDFHIIEKEVNQIKFARNQVGKNDVQDKLAIYKKVQFFGKYSFYFKTDVVKIIVELNFFKQFILVFMAIALPFLIFSFIHGNGPLLIIFILLSVILVWFGLSVVIGVSISDAILSQSIHKLKGYSLDNRSEAR